MRKLRQFLALDGGGKWLFVRAYCLLGVMRAAMALSSFKRLAHGLEHGGDLSGIAVQGGARGQRALEIGRAVRAAARHTPWDSACLVQALVAQRMLRAEGIGGVLYLGAMLGEGDGEDRSFDAHAWVKSGEAFVTGQSGHERYAVVSTFSW